MADEINRANPRTQSALLQAMQEHKVTAGGKDYQLPHPFHVIATRNPIEQEGTYTLPEAQLDRFMLEITVDYPALDDEKKIVIDTTSRVMTTPEVVASEAKLIEIQNVIRKMPIGDALADKIIWLTRVLRPQTTDIPEVKKYVKWGAGIRGGQSLVACVKAKALIDGRETPILDDLRALVVPALKHRMSLNFAARADGITLDDLVISAFNKI